MTDYSRDRLGPEDDDRLPWLEPVEEEPEEDGGAPSRLIIGLIAALVLIGAVVGGFFFLRSSDSASSGDGALIPAPDSYYKERPAAEPTAADDEVVYSASKGNELESVIDTSGTAETPVNVDREPTAAPTVQPIQSAAKPAPATVKTAQLPPSTSKPAPAPKVATAPVPKVAAPKPEPKPQPKPAPVAAEPAPSSGGSGTIQLGAFSSEAKANAAWKTLSGRFSALSGLTSSVVPVQSGDKTLYRLRASGGNGKSVCASLRTAGESCSVIGG